MLRGGCSASQVELDRTLNGGRFACWMNHNPSANKLDRLNVRPLDCRGFDIGRPVALAVACFSVIALMLVAPGFTSSASAQTMGEYGGVTAGP
jgi:hypothetical protein